TRSWSAVAWELYAKSQIWTTPQSPSPTKKRCSVLRLIDIDWKGFGTSTSAIPYGEIDLLRTDND
ncbi:hypothetical protein, partial [uncultured Ruminococcus sp.]|uniref:hypothetical protein n=1 Tax=uncultured Ruminococcus sp. TaxID=165186 RepID=UPI00292D3272